MKIFADNDRYGLRVNAEINRLYIRISGFWRTKEGYLEDLEEACKAMQPGFKIHVDLRTMKAPRQEIGQVHIDAQHLLMSYGLVQTAEILGENALAKLALKKYSDKSGMKKMVFSTMEEAEEWLDVTIAAGSIPQRHS
ncbi:MAG: hypothetical protein AAGA85_25295 [Bacteroidota bacterium]